MPPFALQEGAACSSGSAYAVARAGPLEINAHHGFNQNVLPTPCRERPRGGRSKCHPETA